MTEMKKDTPTGESSENDESGGGVIINRKKTLQRNRLRPRIQSSESEGEESPPSLLANIKESTVQPVRQPRKKRDPLTVLRTTAHHQQVSQQIGSAAAVANSKASVSGGGVVKKRSASASTTAAQKKQAKARFIDSLIDFNEMCPKKVQVIVNL